MRLRFDFEVKEIPLAYRMMVVSIIKDALKHEPEYAEKIFQSKNLKPYSSAVYLKDFHIKDNTITLESLNITVSSANYEFMSNLFNGVKRKKTFQYRESKLKLKNIQMLPENTIDSFSVIIRTLSPFLIETKDGKPLTPYDENYQKEFNYYATLIIHHFLNRNPIEPIRIQPLEVKKEVIKEQSHGKLPKDKPIYFTAYNGLFLLEGNPADLDCLYKNGISRRRSQSFGLFDIVAKGGK